MCLARIGASAADASLTFPLQSTWTATVAAPPQFLPAYDADFVYLSLRNDQLVAISLKDGAVAWSVECPTSAAPAAGGGLVFVGGDGFIESRSREDGRPDWRRSIEGRVTSLYWDTGWLLATTDKGPLYTLRAADGEVLWQRDLGASLHSQPALAGDRVYLSLEDSRLLAVVLQTGETVWTRQLPQPGGRILALADRLFLGSQDNWFYCLDAKNGGTKWRSRAFADAVGMPVIDSRRVFFVALDNVLRALSRNNGTLLWKRTLPMRPSTGPLLSGDTVIVSGQATELRAHSAVQGTPLGDFALRGTQGEELQLAAPPHLATEGLLIIMTRGGQIHGLASAAPAPVAVLETPTTPPPQP